MPSPSSLTMLCILLAVILVYAVVWTHTGWGLGPKWSISKSVAVGVVVAGELEWFYAPIPILIFAIYDVAVRANFNGLTTALWIGTILLIPALGVHGYFIWALLPSNRPQSLEESTTQAT